MNAFFRKIFRALGQTRLFKNFAKPIPKPAPEIFEEPTEPRAELVQISYQTHVLETHEVHYEPIISETEEKEFQSVAVAILPAPTYNFEETPVFLPVLAEKKVEEVVKAEEIVLVPMKIVEKHKTVRKTRPKSVENVKIKKAVKKSKPRAKKKIAAEPVPPEATGFGFQKPVNLKKTRNEIS